MWDTSCPDWRDRILSGRHLVPDLPLFEEEAARALRVFKRLRLPDVVGNPTMADACGPWFFPIVEALFGSFDPVRNVRHIQEVFQLIPKGNSKSSNGGMVMVTALIVNRRPEAEFMLVAPTQTISDIAFKQAKGTIKLDPELDKVFQVQDHIKKITHRRSGAVLEVKAADTDVVTGGKKTGTMIDETHEFAKKSRAAAIFLELRGSLGKRPDGFLFQTTTQSKDPPEGVFKTELISARDVRDGKKRRPLLPILYELPLDVSRDGGWKDRKYWPLVNPNLGRSQSEDFLVRTVDDAVETGPEQEALVASQHFNVEIGQGSGTGAWVGATFWPSRARLLTLEQLIGESDVVVAGIDGGGMDDLLGLGVIGRDAETRDWLLWGKSWASKHVLKLRKSIAQKLQDLVKVGDLVLCDQVGVDIAELVDLVMMIDDHGMFPEKNAVGVDPMGIGQIVDALADRGFDSGRIVGIPQGWRLNGAIKTTERKLADGTFWHAGQEIMTWCVGNAKVVPVGNAVTITKQASGTAKIDQLMASLNAAALMQMNPAPSGGSYLDGEDLLVLD
ncbi:terminase large subunit [Oceanibaculum indicum]|uniref:Phage terminase large subunit-like protein n=1 Tax=Oceanibaculum indicum TaxID=526216 RepID=A0A420WGM4_9PROT|nr:terminase large subunit [Oceanibaculum indicum]RKQ70133.1 phage terminase large subunit-like protein [Oceanibaculum indicum]